MCPSCFCCSRGVNVVEVKNISYAYNAAAGNVPDDVSFSLEPKQCLAILGNNGAGKSTLLKCIDRIIPIKGACVTVRILCL